MFVYIETRINTQAARAIVVHHTNLQAKTKSAVKKTRNLRTAVIGIKIKNTRRISIALTRTSIGIKRGVTKTKKKNPAAVMERRSLLHPLEIKTRKGSTRAPPPRIKSTSQRTRTETGRRTAPGVIRTNTVLKRAPKINTGT